jgi:hypothetical protein
LNEHARKPKPAAKEKIPGRPPGQSTCPVP